MLKPLITLAFLFSIGGCTTTDYGNYSGALPGYSQAMATDTANHLAKLYPPALTRWNMGQPTTDAYGASLVVALRARGYSVAEYTQENARVVPTQPSTTLASNKPGVDLRYIVDDLSTTAALYRVTLIAGQQSLSRAYTPKKGGTVSAAGSWSRKE
jgi:hypothetical protein